MELIEEIVGQRSFDAEVSRVALGAVIGVEMDPVDAPMIVTDHRQLMEREWVIVVETRDREDAAGSVASVGM